MEGQRSESSLIHKDIEIVLKSDDTIFVQNNSSEKYHIYVINPHIKYAGYVNLGFDSNHWISTNPPTWVDSGTNISVEVVLISYDYRFKFIVDFINRTISIEENDLYQINNFQVVPLGITFVMSAYKTAKYINEALESIFKLKDEYFNFEVLVGIDSCGETLKKVTETEYPDYVKFYYFNENLGQRIILNTLFEKAKYENIIILDSDDLFHKNLLKHFVKEIKDYDIVNWGHYIYEEGSNIDDLNLPTKMKYLGCFGIKKNTFLSLNGFFPWRCHSDAEFQERIENYKLKIKNLEVPLFYYRILGSSLSRSTLTGAGSALRKTYITIMDEKRVTGNWVNPSRLYTADCLRIK